MAFPHTRGMPWVWMDGGIRNRNNNNGTGNDTSKQHRPSSSPLPAQGTWRDLQVAIKRIIFQVRRL